MPEKPNIVFLLNDHQAYYRHGWDGGPRIQRPHFDRLASEGVVFNRAYTAMPALWTSASNHAYRLIPAQPRRG
jgi:arylsulfatase A-like enzyme